MNAAEQKSHDMSHGWKPINTAPKDKFVLLACPSGYTTTPWVFTTGILHSDYKVGRWVDHANDDLSDWGMSPIFWRDDIVTPDSATPAPAPAQEVATLSLAAEDVHAAFAKNFPKSRISQAWINFAADIAQAIAARAAKSAQEVGLSDSSIDCIVYEHTKLNPNQGADRALLTGIRHAVRDIIAALRAKGDK